MSVNIHSFSKEAIKARMLQHAVKLWGLKSVSSIDPFVSLLVDAFSTEIFKVNNEIQSIHSRVLEKLAKLLTPTIYTCPQPAHAIALATAGESSEVLPHYTEFFATRQIQSTTKAAEDVQIEIHFTPVDNVKLVKMQVGLMLTPETCYVFDKEHNRLPLLKIAQHALPHHKIILGIDATGYTDPVFPGTLNLYCANPTFEHIDFLFRLLPFVKVSIAGRELAVNAGIVFEEPLEATDGYDELFREYGIRNRIEDNIKNIYKDRFLTLSGLNGDALLAGRLPECLAALPNKAEIGKQVEHKKILWLEIQFPPQFTPEILEDFSFALNAFPVYNRKWKSNEYSLDMMGDNVPLSTRVGEHFLYVEEVVDSHGTHYKEIPFSNSSDLQRGLYTIRKGGMERFNERNAVEMISHVLELTRDEVSAFGVLNRDKVADALKNMTAQMKVLGQKVAGAEKNVLQEINYVIVDPVQQIENLRATYWVTHASLANHIRQGTVLNQPKITKVQVSNKLVLLTETTGGAEARQGTDSIQAYKYALTTRDKIISIEDIKSFCRLLLRDSIRTVEVKRGTTISVKPNEGFIRTLEIEIVPRAYNDLGKTYWDSMAATVKKQIMLRGIDGLEYKVMILNRDHE